jgi:pantetheine-phosphate adenylyltransferase
MAAPDVRAIYPGTFDPVTLGHLDVIRRASRLFSQVHVAVMDNPSKKPLLPGPERVRLVAEEVADLPNVRVSHEDGLAVEVAARLGAAWIVRGLRSEEDAAREIAMARSNRLCGPKEIETVFLAASPEVAFISSTLVREIAARAGKLARFVPPRVEEVLRRRNAPR